MRIATGPAPSHWGEDRLERLYHELAESPVDTVYLGETACAARSCFSPGFFGRMCEELRQAGKEVYASSLALVRREDERRAFDLVARRAQGVEINSPAFLGWARGCRSVAGAFLNVCNATAAAVLAERGVERIVLPCELSLRSIAAIASRGAVATEVVVHGHMPVAISHTCFTARAFGCDDGRCRALCKRYPEGMILEAGDRPLFRVDGPLTLSAATCCLVEYLTQLERAGVGTVRILPQWEHTSRIVRIYRDVLDGRTPCREALGELKALSPDALCNGWLLGKAGWIYESPN